MNVRTIFKQVLMLALLGWALILTGCSSQTPPTPLSDSLPSVLLKSTDSPDNFPDETEIPPDDPPDSGQVTIQEGGLYRELSSPEVYVIHSGRKVWIPTPDALFAMGYNWNLVKEVPDGTLAGYQRFNIPSSSATPGSLVYPPYPAHFPLRGIATATRVVSQGKEIQLIDLRGWLRAVDSGCGDDVFHYGDGEDFHYYLEVDSDWAIAQGIDLNRLLRVGNVAFEAIGLSSEFSPRKAVAIPLIKIELDRWGRGPDHTHATEKPADWTFADNCGDFWPFNYYRPDPSGPALQFFAPTDLNWRGPYVRIAGSLISDVPHDVQHRPSTILSRHFAITTSSVAEWEGSVPDWSPGLSSDDMNHNARWTEIHPPDLIQVLDWQPPRSTMRGVALAARVGVLPGDLSNSCEAVEFDMTPEADRPANSRLAYEELRGPETYFPWGENNDNGSWISVYDDHIHVRARVCGGAVFGSAGRFKALYRVWWEPNPFGERSGSFVTSDDDRIDYVIRPNVVAADGVVFVLCNAYRLKWEKRLNMPDGEGNSWDIVVRDDLRCAENSLWAHQVTNGQVLTFSKAKFLGTITQVFELPLSDLGSLPGGTRVTFTWMKDG